jgi:hypothetical protein
MNLRCSFCQTPFSIGRMEKLAALQHMYAENLNHYDAHCPRCRRANTIMRQKLEMTLPNWREELKELEVEMAAHPQPAAASVQPKPEPAPVTQTESGPEPVPTKTKTKAATQPKPSSSKLQAGRPRQAARSESGPKPPATNTPKSRGKKKSK